MILITGTVGSCLCYQEVKDHEDAKKIHEMKGASMVRRLWL